MTSAQNSTIGSSTTAGSPPLFLINLRLAGSRIWSRSSKPKKRSYTQSNRNRNKAVANPDQAAVKCAVVKPLRRAQIKTELRTWRRGSPAFRMSLHESLQRAGTRSADCSNRHERSPVVHSKKGSQNYRRLRPNPRNSDHRRLFTVDRISTGRESRRISESSAEFETHAYCADSTFG